MYKNEKKISEILTQTTECLTEWLFFDFRNKRLKWYNL